MNIEIKEPDYDDGWFRYRTKEALGVLESRRHPRFEGRQQFLNVLSGMYRHAYNKGRHDEKQAQQENITKVSEFGAKTNG